MVTFISQSKIFKNEEVFSPEHLPEMLPHRENQIKQLADNLLPASKGRKPQNTFIFGSPGIGKTAVAKFVFREFEEYSGIKTIYMNCWDFNTSLAVLSKIVSDFGMFVQRRGWARDEVILRLIEALEKSKKALIVCLDEVDQLIYKDQKVLYDLLRLNQYVKNPIGLIFISNNPHIFANLEPRIMSSLSLEEIEFEPYTLQEMRDILQERVEYGFYSVEEGVVALASAHAINKGGDVRVGLECLLKAGRLAEKETSDKVKVLHVKKVLKTVDEVKPRILKEKITDVEKLILDILNNEKKTLTFDEIYDIYSKNVESPLTKRMFREYVNHLESINLIKIGKRKFNRSRFILKV
ncbi:MAG: AAA family ATPase [Candidatus Aenigmatarchaeota archaeon]|nr:AAA family ATPase [Candidatus Aenigmarchaeota archaeon]